jgi:hypothetical protein
MSDSGSAAISGVRSRPYSGYNRAYPQGVAQVRWIRWIALLAGIVLFAVSFILPAVKEVSAGPNSQGVPGFTCATLTLEMPWSKDGLSILHESPLRYFSILLSGWINPAFLVTLGLVLIKPRWRPTIVLRYVVTLMFVFCWIVFYQVHLYPRQGYFLWMFGILLALYSNKLSRS